MENKKITNEIDALEYLEIKKYFTEKGLINFRKVFASNAPKFLQDFKLDENKKKTTYKGKIKEHLENVVNAMKGLLKDNNSLTAQSKFVKSVEKVNELFDKMQKDKVNEEELYLIISLSIFISLFEYVDQFLDIEKFLKDKLKADQKDIENFALDI